MGNCIIELGKLKDSEKPKIRIDKRLTSQYFHI